MRLCKECGIREVEYRCQYCSECAENRRYFSDLIKREKWKNNNPERYKECYLKNNRNYRARLKDAKEK